ncbi:MAG: hypothetical protein WD037_11370 [Balneolales bacterium]
MTSWLMLLLQSAAILIAIFVYSSWRYQAKERAKHDNIVSLFESATLLKNGVLEFDDSSDRISKIQKLMEKHTNINHTNRQSYNEYQRLKSLYDKHLLEPSVITKTKADTLQDLYQLETLHDKTVALLEDARKRSAVFTSQQYDKKEITSRFVQFRDELKESSKFLRR